MNKYSKYLMILVVMLSACGQTNNDVPPEMFLTPPAMSVTVTRKNCPSMEVQVGMQVMWVSGDTATIPITLEELDDHGNVITTGKSEINAENQFSDADWQSEERERHVKEFEKDVKEAEAGLEAAGGK